MKWLSIGKSAILILPLMLLLSCGTTSQVNSGVAFYNQGQYDQAAAQWNKPALNGDPSAQYNLGLMWRDGLGSTPKNLNEAAAWFLKSAQQGYVPAMVRLAEVQSTLGYETAAISWLNLAARWGSSEAVQHLNNKRLPSPQADLLYAQQQEQARRDTVALGIILNNLNSTSSGSNGTSSTKHSGSTTSTNPCNCKGYDGPGGPCYSGPGGGAYAGPGGPAYDGPGGPCYSGPGGPTYDGPGGPRYDGPGGPAYDGPGGPAYDGPGGPCYSGPGGPAYDGPGGPCYSGPGGTGKDCPVQCW